MFSPVCVAEHLSFQRKNKVVLNDLSFSVKRGRITGLFGENGAGKSTLIKLILGILPASTGSLTVLDAAPGSCPTRIGYLPENIRFYEHLTVREHLAFFARLKGVPQSKVDEIAGRLAVLPFIDQVPGTCSKGQMQRVGLAQALLTDPDFLLLDEPTSGLDPATVTALYEELKSLATKGCAVLVCTHELALAEHYIDAVLMLGNGRIAAQSDSLCGLAESVGLPYAIRFERSVTFLQCPVGTFDGGVLWVKPQQTQEAVRYLTQEKGIFDFTVTAPTLTQLFTRCTSPREAR